MTELPDDVVDVLRYVQRMDEDDYGELATARRRAVAMLEQYGVPVKTTEELVREEAEKLRLELANARRTLAEAKAEVKRITETVQQRNRTINELRAKVKKLEAEQSISVAVGSEQLAERARAMLTAAQIPADITVVAKEPTDAQQ